MLLAACTGGPSPQPTPGATLRTPTPPTPQPTFQPDDFTALVLESTGGTSPAGSDLDTRWRALFDAVEITGEEPYRPPTAVIGYRAGDVPDTDCARGKTPARWRDNAFFCAADQRIVFDEDWLRSIKAEIGPEAVLALLAHEWGHHVQHLLNLGTESIREELQADCYAGMYLIESGLLPHGSLEDEDPALTAAMTAFFSLGNTEYKASEWFAAQEHGSPVQRILATSTGLLSHQVIDRSVAGGMEKGLPWCFGYADYDVGDVVEIGPYRFLEFPGRTSTRAGEAYVIESETRTGQAGSRVVMQWLQSLPNPGGATIENLQAIWDSAWAGIQALPPEPTISASNHGGTGLAAAYQYVDGSGSNAQSGEFGLISPADGEGGLLVLAYQPRLADTEAEFLAIAEDAITTINQVMARLCTPDEGPSPAASNLDPVCMDVQ